MDVARLGADVLRIDELDERVDADEVDMLMKLWNCVVLLPRVFLLFNVVKDGVLPYIRERIRNTLHVVVPLITVTNLNGR